MSTVDIGVRTAEGRIQAERNRPAKPDPEWRGGHGGSKGGAPGLGQEASVAKWLV